MINKAFTLLELMVVVVIIAILASLAVPQFMVAVEKARAAEGVTILGAVRGAQLRYYQQWGTGADSMSKLDCDIPTPKFFESLNVVWWDDTCKGETARIVVNIHRKASYQDPYSLYMDINGNITCYRDYGFDICSKIGFKACN